jgi:hypothetical protein
MKSLKLANIEVTNPEHKGICLTAIGEYNGKPFFLYFLPSSWNDTILLKIEREPHDCVEAVYCPRGLYAVVQLHENIKSLAQRLKNKIEFVVRVYG